MLKRFASALALVAVLGLNAVAQECSGTSSCEVKVKAKSSCCQEATLAKKQDQEAPKKAECSTSSCG
ncbi:MAG: hypothetical protein KDB53_01225, partial [Planctomycetes bacterium]|nr:hypothetical protein [Planctomycetota bacterium]